jgi:hypothetical protein
MIDNAEEYNIRAQKLVAIIVKTRLRPGRRGISCSVTRQKSFTKLPG